MTPNPTIIRWHQPDEAVPQPTPAFEDDSWVAGAQRCFVGVAIAGAALALSVSVAAQTRLAIQNEEIVPQVAALEVDAWAAPLPLRAAVTAIVWATDEGTIPGLGVDEDHWLPPRPAPVKWHLLPLGAQDELGSTPAVALDEEHWPLPRALPSVPAAAAQWDDQALAWTIDEQYTWQAQWVPWAGAPTQPWVGQQDEQPTAEAAVPPEDSAAWSPLLPAQPAPTLALWFGEDEVTQAPTPLAADEDAWWPHKVETAKPVLAQQHDEGSAAFAAAAPTVDDDAWLLLAPPAQRALVLRPWVEDDLPVLTIDEEAWQPRTAQARVHLFEQWQLDDLPAPKLDDDTWDGWRLPPAARPVLALWFGEDEVAQPAVPLPVDEAYLWPPLPTMPPTTSLWVAADNEDVPELTAPPTPAPTPAPTSSPGASGGGRKRPPMFGGATRAPTAPTPRPTAAPKPTRDPFLTMLMREDDDLVRLVREMYGRGDFEPRK